jgi:hypothetical protein
MKYLPEKPNSDTGAGRLALFSEPKQGMLTCVLVLCVDPYYWWAVGDDRKPNQTSQLDRLCIGLHS